MKKKSFFVTPTCVDIHTHHRREKKVRRTNMFQCSLLDIFFFGHQHMLTLSHPTCQCCKKKFVTPLHVGTRTPTPNMKKKVDAPTCFWCGLLDKKIKKKFLLLHAPTCVDTHHRRGKKKLDASTCFGAVHLTEKNKKKVFVTSPHNDTWTPTPNMKKKS